MRTHNTVSNILHVAYFVALFACLALMLRFAFWSTIPAVAFGLALGIMLELFERKIESMMEASRKTHEERMRRLEETAKSAVE